MGRLGITITKSTTFRGAAQEFGNTYYYETPGVPTQTNATDLISLIVTREKAMHASSVNFLRARAWTAGGTPAENEQLAQQTLSGSGTGGTSPTALDKERAFLVRARAGSDSRGRPVYLRKWWHLGISIKGGASLSDAQLGNTAALDAGMRTALEADFDALKDLVPTSLGGGHATLVSDKGRAITGATQAHPYLEHHQLGEMWR